MLTSAARDRQPGSDQPESVFEILAARCAAGIASQEAEHEDPKEEEDDRVHGNLEGKHGDRPASDTAIILWGMTGSQPGSTPCR